MKFGTQFPNKFATKSYKCFPPHLNSNVSTLPCETWHAHQADAAIALLQKETAEFILSQLSHPNSSDSNPVDYSMWKCCKRNCTKPTLLIWRYRRRHWRMAAAMTMWSSLVQVPVAVSVHPDQWCVFCTPSLAVFRHAVINWIQIWRIWKP